MDGNGGNEMTPKRQAHSEVFSKATEIFSNNTIGNNQNAEPKHNDDNNTDFRESFVQKLTKTVEKEAGEDSNILHLMKQSVANKV